MSSSRSYDKKHKHHHHDISIFNKVDIKVEQPPAPPTTPAEKEDSCASCFKAIVKCIK